MPLDRARLKTLAVIGPNAKGVHLGGYSVDPRPRRRRAHGDPGEAGDVGARSSTPKARGSPRSRRASPPGTRTRSCAGDPAKNRERIAEARESPPERTPWCWCWGATSRPRAKPGPTTTSATPITLDLPGQQDDLVEAVAKAGKPMVAVLLNGRPHSIVSLAGRVPAILEGWYLGQEGGTAVADVLFGDVNPSGKLPISIPRSVGQLPVYHDRKPTSYRQYLFATRDPLFLRSRPELLDLRGRRRANVEPGPDRLPRSATQVTARVANTGSRAGETVVQLYIRDRVSSVTRPVQELAGFTRVALGPGETKTVRFDLGPEALSLLDEDLHRVVEPGFFDVMVGTSPAEAVKVDARSHR